MTKTSMKEKDRKKIATDDLDNVTGGAKPLIHLERVIEQPVKEPFVEKEANEDKQ